MKFISYPISMNGAVLYSSKPTHPPLKYFKLVPEAFAPEWATEHSGCFDLRACLPVETTVKIFTVENNSYNQTLCAVEGKDALLIRTHQRALIPTGLILDIPFGYTVRIHPRSGLALKQAIVLANQEGIVDSDYVEPTFVILHNLSDVSVTIHHGDRIAQAEMVPDIAYELLETPDKPQQKTDRAGGFGSTGVK